MARHDIGRHDGDCSIYASLDNYGVPEAGICTCGAGHKYLWDSGGDKSHLYSRELRLKMARKARARGRLYRRRLMEMIFGDKSLPAASDAAE